MNSCFYCGAILNPTTYTEDHLIPRSRGGSNKLDNRVTCCRKCNCSKGNKTLEEYRTYLKSGFLDVDKVNRTISRIESFTGPLRELRDAVQNYENSINKELRRIEIRFHGERSK